MESGLPGLCAIRDLILSDCLCLAETGMSVGNVDPTVEERAGVEGQSSEEESKAGAPAAALSEGQDVPTEATATSSPDTDSPVMISVDVSVIHLSCAPTPPPHFVDMMSKLKLLLLFINDTQEVGSGNTSQKSDEEDFVKLDDLPLQLTVMCEVCKD